eukprot:3940561-Rhodomonas_salina.3
MVSGPQLRVHGLVSRVQGSWIRFSDLIVFERPEEPARHTLPQYHTSRSTIRHLSTTHRVALYATSVPHIAKHHTLPQYCTSRSTIRYLSTARLSTAHRIPYAYSELHIA